MVPFHRGSFVLFIMFLFCVSLHAWSTSPMTLYDSSSLAQSEFIGLPFSSAHGAAVMFHSLGCPPSVFRAGPRVQF